MRLTGKVALVSGAVSGIGLGIARAFAEQGIFVGIGYRSDTDLKSALDSLSDFPSSQFLPVRLDVTKPADWAEAVAKTKQAFGRFDILVNNAGVSFAGTIDKATQSDWDWIMEVNFYGVIRGVEAALPVLREQGEGGHIINVTSMAAYLPAAEVGLYSTSKFAARGYSAALRLTLASENIGVSELAPGLTRSNIHMAATKRPAAYSDTSFNPAPEFVEAFGQMMSKGMDPVEVGRKAVEGMAKNAPVIFSHGEFMDEMREASDALVAAVPLEEIPAERRAAEDARKANQENGGGITGSD